ncbi:MAG: GC-type dockerin domain-anchored protein [Planctomycetota bacterium]
MRTTLHAAVLLALAGTSHGQTVTWDGEGGDLLWETGDNWNPDGVPPDGANVIIDAGGTVIGPTAPLDLGSVMAMSGLEIKGALVTAGPSIITDLLFASCCSQNFVTNGALTIQGNSTFLQRPFFQGGAQTTVNGTALFQSGVNVTNDALRLSGDDITIFQAANSDGGGAIDGLVYLAPNGALTSSATGGWEVRDGGAVGLRSDAPANAQATVSTNLILDGGELFADAGKLNVTGAYEFKGNSEIDALQGATVELRGTGGVTIADTAFEGEGTVLLNSGNITITGPIANGMTSDPAMGDSGLRIDANLTLNSDLVSDGLLTLAPGTVSGSGKLISRGATRMVGGSTLNAEVLIAGGEFEVSKPLSVGRQFRQDAGTLRFSNGGGISPVGNLGFLNIQGGAFISDPGSPGDTVNIFVDVGFFNATPRVRSGRLILRDQTPPSPNLQLWSNTDFTVDAGARALLLPPSNAVLQLNRLTLNGGGGFELGGNTSSLQPTLGLLDVVNNLDGSDDAGLVIKTSLTGGPNDLVNNGRCRIEGSFPEIQLGIINTGTLEIISTPTLRNAGAIVNTGTVVQRGSINFAELSDALNQSLWRVTQSSNQVLLASGGESITNTGLYHVGTTSFIGHTIQPLFNNVGVLLADNAEVVVSNALQRTTDGRLVGGVWRTINNGRIRFSGILQTVSGPDTEVSGKDTSLPDLALQRVEDGATLEATGDLTTTDLDVADGSEVRINDGATLLGNTLGLTGGSTLSLQGEARVEQSDRIDIGASDTPGPPSVLDEISDVVQIGRGPANVPTIKAPQIDLHAVFRPGGEQAGGGFLVDGSLTSFDTATWAFDIDPLGVHDVVLGSGTFALAGTLDLAFTQPPSADDEFVVVAPGDGLSLAITGAFNTVASTGLPASLRAETIYNADSVRVRIVCNADTNGDGAINPADFSAWVIAFNNQSPACDQNGDGLCNPADFTAWVINFNAGCD